MAIGYVGYCDVECYVVSDMCEEPLLCVPKRHSLHEVGILQTSAQIVFTQPLSMNRDGT